MATDLMLSSARVDPAWQLFVAAGMPGGDFRAWKEQSQNIPPATPTIQPPGQAFNPITPPASISSQQPTQMSQLGVQNSIPMPEQLARAARQSSLFGDNWASLFSQG